MKKLFTLIAYFMAILVSSCSEYDDTEIWNKLSDHENRIVKLEELCRQMNTNITALQTIVNALQKNDYITNVAPVREDGKIIGYTITFAYSDTITIYHGEDGVDGEDGADGQNGKDGYTPKIGVMKDSDGVYYWSVDGEWLLDAKGNKIKAQGTDGSNGANGIDGITPRLKIEDDYWYVSYDDGVTWTELGKASGDDGDSFFLDVNTKNADYVIFTLADGVELILPRFKNLSISFDIADGAICMPSASIKVGYTLRGADSETSIETIGDGGWTSEVTKTDISSGYITVTSPENGGDGKVVMIATTSNGFTAMKAISFEEGVIEGIDDVYRVGCETSVLNVSLKTNLNYVVNISDDAKTWISVADTRATIRTETLTFTIEENSGVGSRSANIELIDKNGNILQRFVIMQNGGLRYVRFNTAVNSEGVAPVYIRMNTAGKTAKYQLPLFVEGNTPHNEELKVKIDYDLSSLEELNIKHFGSNRMDMWWQPVPDDAISFPSYVTIPSDQSVAMLDIDLDLTKLDLVNRYVLSLKIVENQPYYSAEINNNALLNIIPFNDFSGSYSASTMSGYPADDNGNFSNSMSPLTVSNKIFYAVDDNTVFFYPGIIDHTYKQRADYKVYIEFDPSGALLFNAPNPDLDFQIVGPATYECPERYDANKPYLLYKYVILQFTYDFTDHTGAVPTRYRFKGAMTMQRAINTQIPDEDQAIQW